MSLPLIVNKLDWAKVMILNCMLPASFGVRESNTLDEIGITKLN